MIKHNDQKGLGKERVYFSLQLEFLPGKFAQDPKAGPGGGADEGYGGVLLTGLLVLLFIQPRTTFPGWHCPQCTGPTCVVINQENVPWASLQVHLKEEFSQLRFPSLKLTEIYQDTSHWPA